jgi:hypothetical protein
VDTDGPIARCFATGEAAEGWYAEATAREEGSPLDPKEPLDG